MAEDKEIKIAEEKGPSAEDIAKEFKEHSVAEFFKKNMQMLGLTGKIKTLTTIVHEYVTNSVTADTPTLTRTDGETSVERIGTIVNNLMEKHGAEYSQKQDAESLRDFKKFEVLCFDKQTNKLKFKEVKSIHRHKMGPKEKIFRIQTVGNRAVEATKHHGLFSLKDGKITETKAEELAVGDYLVVPRKSWIEETKKEINLLEECLKLSDNELGEFGIYGIKNILYTNTALKNKIKSQLTPTQRNLDFYRDYMKCDRLPLRLLKILNDGEKRIFYKCKLGIRHSKYKLPIKIPLTKELMHFLGLYIAEGSTRKTTLSSALSFGSHENGHIEYSKFLIENIFGFKPIIRKAHKTAINVEMPSATASFVLTKIFRCGIGAKNKRIPAAIFGTSKELAKEFLFAYLSGDGYPSAKIFNSLINGNFDLEEKITLATASEELSLGLRYLLSGLGYSYSYSEKEAYAGLILGKKASFGKGHTIEFYAGQKNSPLNFYPLKIGGIESVTEPKLKWAINTRGQQVASYEKIASLKLNEAKILEEAAKFIAGDLGLLQITEIEERTPKENEYVYDYSVEGDENFVGGYGAICLHNSLDACEESKILPDIEVQIKELSGEYYEITVKDNGPGLTHETVGKALGKLLAGTKFHRMMQLRGQQGIGAAGCTMLSQITTGKATSVITGTGKGKPFSAEITIDPKKNEPKLANVTELNKEFSGTIIKAKFKGVKYVNSEQAPLEYLRRTAVANPHAQITLIEPNGEKVVFKRTLKEIPARPIEMKPHPKGATIDDLISLSKYSGSRKVSSFLKESYDRLGDKAIEEIAKGISFDINKDPRQLTWDEAEEIVRQFRKISFIAPRTDGLIPIGEDRIEKSLKSIVNPEFLSVITRKPSVYKGGFPFLIEVGIAYGGNAGRMGETNEEGVLQRKIEIMRFANRAPLLFDTGGCAITKAVQSIDWKRYGMKDYENAPLTIFVNLISVHIPYTSTGKQAISDEDEIMEELRLALMETGRKIYTYVGRMRRQAEKEAKKKMFYKYATEVALAVAELTGRKRNDVEEKLHALVLKHLKLEEQREKEAEAKGEASEDEIEKNYERRKAKEKKEAEKKAAKAKGPIGGEAEGE